MTDFEHKTAIILSVIGGVVVGTFIGVLILVSDVDRVMKATQRIEARLDAMQPKATEARR